MRELTKEQLQVLQHALGVDQYGRGRMYRNHFCAGGADEEICRGLVELGLMYVFAENKSPLPYYNCSVTEEGKAEVLRQSPKPPKSTRGQQRYQRFLKADGVFGSFKDFLKHEKEYANESRYPVV